MDKNAKKKKNTDELHSSSKLLKMILLHRIVWFLIYNMLICNYIKINNTTKNLKRTPVYHGNVRIQMNIADLGLKSVR